jgi:hypothetical protein
MPWFSVRCLIRFAPDAYEERITVWEAPSFEQAIQNAEVEVIDYVDGLSGEYVGLAQAFVLAAPPSHGAEVSSLVRESALSPKDYIERFLDTGVECQQSADESE